MANQELLKKFEEWAMAQKRRVTKDDWETGYITGIGSCERKLASLIKESEGKDELYKYESNTDESINLLRAMIYELLAALERAKEVEAKRTDKGGEHIILDVQFKY